MSTDEVEVLGEEMNDAIETAVHCIRKKESKKHHKKHCHLFKRKPSAAKVGQRCSCNEMQLELQEGKESKVIKSPRMNRRSVRREAVAEKNETERKLVKETIKVVLKGSNIDEYNF